MKIPILLSVFLVAVFAIAFTPFTSLSQNPTAPASPPPSLFPEYKEIAEPAGFINTDPITIKEFIGKKIILVDFMTYSCINCVRTFPYLNAWNDKYKDEGLEIIGIHTPEFAFEKKKENVEAAMKKYGIEFPIVLDNTYGTWRAYDNTYWPRTYLIDLDGHIVYDHIGEGNYEKTEEKIQELLHERKKRLGEKNGIDDMVITSLPEVDFSAVKSPETYFGSLRNPGIKPGTLPAELNRNTLYLTGEWNITPEFAENKTANATIVYRYHAKNVFLVLSADKSIPIHIFRDGKLFDTITINADGLYTLVEDDVGGEHTLEIIIPEPGVKAFAFTFG